MVTVKGGELPDLPGNSGGIAIAGGRIGLEPVLDSEPISVENSTMVLDEPAWKDIRLRAFIKNAKFDWFVEGYKRGYCFDFDDTESDHYNTSDEDLDETNSEYGSIGSWSEEETVSSVYFGKFDFQKALGLGRKKKTERGESSCKECIPIEGPIEPLYSFTIDMDNIPEKFQRRMRMPEEKEVEEEWAQDERLWDSESDHEEAHEGGEKNGGNKKEGKHVHEPP